MFTITMKDWAGLLISTTDMTESDLGYDGDIVKLQKFAQRVANDKTASVKIEEDGTTIVTASYLNEVC